eukprot:GFUD01031456.1.p1 GENE.GFUD01031456.1~~GFUD01031456.1.p1  ORF type:complete len:240 (+),score=56.83 GFUD01031456.1:103-822(+)
MRQPTYKWKAYVLLKDEVMLKLPENIDIFSIKKEFQTMITSKRRFERISTVNQLVEELERQLIINPDKTGIQEFYNVIIVLNALHPQAIELDLLTKVENLAKNCMPLPPRSTLPPRSRKDRLTDNIRNILAIELVMCGGKDWEHFAMKLGFSLKEKDTITYSRVRIKQGEFDDIEKQMNGDIPLILNTVLSLFEDRCMKFGVKIDLLDHIIDILKRKEIFGTSMLADKIKKERDMMETF